MSIGLILFLIEVYENDNESFKLYSEAEGKETALSNILDGFKIMPDDIF